MADLDTFTLSSSAISGGTYDADTDELTIEFASGGSYTYYGVPVDVVERLKTAPSPGKFFHQAIKNSYSRG